MRLALTVDDDMSVGHLVAMPIVALAISFRTTLKRLFFILITTLLLSHTEHTTAATPTIQYFSQVVSGNGSFTFSFDNGGIYNGDVISNIRGVKFTVLNNGNGTYTAIYTGFPPNSSVLIMFSGDGGYHVSEGS